jgi:hypothetical protein
MSHQFITVNAVQFVGEGMVGGDTHVPDGFPRGGACFVNQRIHPSHEVVPSSVTCK